MATRLGTYLGTNLGTTQGTGDDDAVNELATLEDYLARNLFSWMRADYRTEAASKVTAFQDKVYLPANGGLAGNARSIDPNHALSQASAPLQVATVTTDARMNGKEVATFTSAQRYLSTLAPTSWRFLHAGTGMRCVNMIAPAATSLAVILDTRTGAGAGYTQFVNGPNQLAIAVTQAAAGVIVSSSSGSFTVNQSTYIDDSYAVADTPDWSHAIGQLAPATGDQTGSPSPTTDPDSTLCLGMRSNGAVPWSGLWADLLIANSTSSAIDVAIRRYITLRYAR